MITVEPYQWWHLRRFGIPRLDEAKGVSGFTCFEDGVVIAVGVAHGSEDGRVWVSLAGPMRPIFHRWAIRLLKALQDRGVRQIWAAPDASIEGSGFWLERMGFRQVSEREWLRDDHELRSADDQRDGDGYVGVRAPGAIGAG